MCMKWGEFLSKFANQPLFHASMLQIFPESQAYIQVQLSRWVGAGKLLQIRRGWYLIAEPYRLRAVPPAVIANRVVTPSYLSLDWALSFYSIIPETAPNPTSVTTSRAENFQADGSLFIYRHIKPTYFTGYLKARNDDNEILIASPEKALWDKLYLYIRNRKFSIQWLKELRLQNLEEFNLSRWKEYTRKTSLTSLHRASSLVAEYIREIL
jgi:predicted transcriptional regulator of viral defense system